MEQKQDKDQEDPIQVISDKVKMETTTVHIDVLRFALGNDIIMENIVNSLGLEDLDHWYEFCKKFQFHDLTNMDRICWKKRAQKLAEAYKSGPLTQPIEERWPKSTFREMHTMFKNRVDSRVDEIKDLLQSGVFEKRRDVVQAASFAYHGLLGLPGPCWGLRLSVKICRNLQKIEHDLYKIPKICRNLENIEQDLSYVPTAYLASLKAYVSEISIIFLVNGHGMQAAVLNDGLIELKQHNL